LVGLNRGKRGECGVSSLGIAGWSVLALSRLVWRGSLVWRWRGSLVWRRRGRDLGWRSASSAAPATMAAGAERGRDDRKDCCAEC
jgi:hypothetical protein